MENKYVVTREHRMAFVIMIDLSGSMNDRCSVDNLTLNKSDYVIESVNSILEELYSRSMRNGEIADYFDVAVITYSGDRVDVISSTDGSKSFTPISKLYRNRRDYFRVEKADLDYDISESSNVYNDGVVTCSVGGYTPMFKAINDLCEMQQIWCSEKRNRESISPFIINITDGMFNDSDTPTLIKKIKELTSIRTNIGETLFFNLFVATENHEESIVFPTDEELSRTKNQYFTLMGKLSSIMPEEYRELVENLRLANYEKQRRGEIKPFEMDNIYGGDYHAICFDIEISDLISVLRIGTDAYIIN